MRGHGHHTKHCTNPAKCVNCGKDHLSRSSDHEVWEKRKRNHEIKVIKSLTYPEVKKLYDRKPELTFAKVVQSLSLQSQKPKQRTRNIVLKTQKSQKVRKLLSQKYQNQMRVLNLYHHRNQVLSHNQVRKTYKMCLQINQQQDKQTRQNKQTNRVRTRKQTTNQTRVK